MHDLDTIKKLNQVATLGSCATQEELERYLEQERQDNLTASEDHKRFVRINETNGISPLVETPFTVDTVPTEYNGPVCDWPTQQEVANALGENSLEGAWPDVSLPPGRHEIGHPRTYDDGYDNGYVDGLEDRARVIGQPVAHPHEFTDAQIVTATPADDDSKSG